MLKQWKTIITITIILTNINSFSFGQKLNGLSYNHAITNAISEGDKGYQKSTPAIINFDTEFFDDFSTYHYSVFPRNEHWADRYAYINSTYADSMISLGVATLDAFNENGYPYYSIDSSNAVPSDTLTSQPFHFLHTLTDTMYFSFFYQAGGKGDMPEGLINDILGGEGKDSLLVDFFSVEEDRWNNVFYTLDNTDTFLFKQVVLKVDSPYLQEGFRFRFRNYTSLPSNYQEGQDLGMFSNADQWHIDYIRMKEAKSADELTTLKDIAIVKPLYPTLTEYTSVPWHHFTLAQSSLEGVRRNIPFSVQNFDPDDGEIVSFHRRFKVIDLRNGESLFNRDFENFLAPFEFNTYMDDFTSGLNYSGDPDDTIGCIEILGYIEPTVALDQPLENDTVKRKEVYHDQYAYDDGTAEFGFGINGENEEFLRIAQRYRIFRRNDNPDTLQAVLIYFGKSIDSTTAKYSYSVSIRKNNGSVPSNEIIYTSDTLSPDYSLHLNEFTRIEIDPPILISDTFFVVVNQIDGYLNIGYDINNNNLNKIYVYSNQTWTCPYSLKKGSLMIRPSFGSYSLPTEIEEKASDPGILRIYPNPATDILNFDFPGNLSGMNDIQIFNVMGVKLFHSRTAELSVPVSALSPGVYFIMLTSPDGHSRQTAKFIKE